MRGKNRKFTREHGKLFFIMSIVAACLCVSVAGIRYIDAEFFKNSSLPVTGTILGKETEEPPDEKSETNFYLTYQFEAPCDDGQICIVTSRKRISYSIYQAYNLGDAVTLRYSIYDLGSTRLDKEVNYYEPLYLACISLGYGFFMYLLGLAVGDGYEPQFNYHSKEYPARVSRIRFHPDVLASMRQRNAPLMTEKPIKKKNDRWHSLPKEHYFRED